MDEMLESAPAGQLDEWGAFYELEPFGDEWHQMSTATTTIINLAKSVAASFAGEELKKEDLLPTDAYKPFSDYYYKSIGGKTEPVELAPQELLTRLKLQFGFTKV